ncbi:AI-2E family transporter [Aerosakkonemataceae cyanobacterium BLCC-F154]|uniref:AI-2E family transporter n=2 Tax=Floridanema TaxID=3396149 RepID=A0ABV4Y706_9CYAN
MNFGKWIGFFVLVVSLYILWQIREIILMFFTSVVFATALNRVVKRLQQSGAKRGIALGLTVGMVITITLLCFFLIFTPLTKQLQQLVQLIPYGIDQIETWTTSLQARVPSQFINNVPSFSDLSLQLQKLFSWVVTHLYLVLSNSLALLLNFLLIIVLTIMLLVNPKPYRNVFISLFPAFYRRRVDQILTECEKGLIGWLKGVALSMIFIGITSTIGLWFLDVPLPFVNGLLATILALIPYIGAILSVVPPMFLALLYSPIKAVFVIVLYTLIQQIEGNFVTPIVMEKQVSLLPAYTLAILTAFGVFFGFLGLFLALPILIVLQTWVREVVIKDVLDRWETAR